MPVKPKRFMLTRDESCHWYIIPASKREAWFQWWEEDEDANPPKWAISVNGAPERVTFTDPRIG